MTTSSRCSSFFVLVLVLVLVLGHGHGLGHGHVWAQELDLGPVASYGEDVQAATIAVSAKGRVSLAVATKGGLELVDWTRAAGAKRRWGTGAPVVARGEDRPQIGFGGDKPWIAALQGHTVVVFHPEEGGSSFLTVGAEAECVVAAASDLVAWTEGGSLRVAPDTVADERVCPCCRPALALAPGGARFVAYRDELGDNIRDIFLLRLPGHAPVRVSTENWKSEQCPMAGPAIVAPDEKTVVVAYVVPDKPPELKVAVSADGGASFAKAVKVADGAKPQLAALGGRTVALAYDGAQGGVFVALSKDAGMTWGAPARVDEAKAGVASSGVAIAAEPKGGAWVSWIDKQGEKRAVSARRVAVKE